ncbi:hypothetical protein [Streptomyces sp. Ac-502]|uniref:hypothetical protein n=1 Tax=Streptomyces sp. Ac-502 TaxID=3342801 RepID=UPI0038626E20
MNTDAIVAAGSVLAGAGMTGLIQYATFARSARARQRARIGEAADALGGALIDYRRPVYLKVTAARDGADAASGHEARWAAWSTVTRSLGRLQRVAAGIAGASDLVRVAREAVATTAALNDAAGDVASAIRGCAPVSRLAEAEDALAEAGDEARHLDEQLMAAAIRATGGA